MMPTSYVRLSAGREQMNEQTGRCALWPRRTRFFYGCKLLTTPNPAEGQDLRLFRKLRAESATGEGVLAGDNEERQRRLERTLTPDTDVIITTRQPYELATTRRRRCADGASGDAGLTRRRYMWCRRAPDAGW